MKKIRLHDNERGYVLEIAGTMKSDGEFSYLPTETLVMLEKIGEALLEKKVKVEER